MRFQPPRATKSKATNLFKEIGKSKSSRKPNKAAPKHQEKALNEDELVCTGCDGVIHESESVFECPECYNIFHSEPIGEHMTLCWKRAGGCCDICQECQDNKVSKTMDHFNLCDPCWDDMLCDVCHSSIHTHAVDNFGHKLDSEVFENIVERCEVCGQIYHFECAEHNCG